MKRSNRPEQKGTALPNRGPYENAGIDPEDDYVDATVTPFFFFNLTRDREAAKKRGGSGRRTR